MSLEQIVDYYEEMTAKLDELYVQHSTELTMIKELLGVIYIAQELTPEVTINMELYSEHYLDSIIDLNEHWKDVA